MAGACFEPFPEWMEEKGDLGIFESLPLETSNLAIPEAVKKLPVAHKEGVSDTSFLLQEFQSIYDQLELNNASLTPPQSPTLPSYTNIYNVADSLVISQPQQLAQVQFIQVTPLVPAAYLGKKDPFVVPVAFVEKKPEEPLLTSFEQIVPATPSTDLAHEMTVVDELVRMCADEMVPDVETSSTSGKSWVENGERESPVSSDGGSDSEVLFSYPPSPYLSSSSRSSSGDEDPDYAPCVVPHSAGTGKGGRGKKRSAKDHVSPAPDEKKMRKKEQNKNAATRYRKKKKAEIEEILGEEKGLEVKNDELNKQVEDLSREIRYLKGFMRDIFKAKGFIK
ncbi:activating transcription factor of chaperone isoform X2 [Bacillus rossius redtenbacheri]|uniref:activating transcription factor of chaperone isoform X2 n=1 Tax=Bacillus rossius redtenbacheri TaxID=93214 RepID=UPI002FDDE110